MVNKKEGVMWFEIIFFLANVIIVSFLYRNIALTSILLFIITLVGLAKWKSMRTLLIFIFGGIIGTLAEMVAIYFGVWSYSITNILNVPFWLFILWGNAAMFVYQVGKKFREKRLKIK
jgi:hypothetical protein